MRREARRLLGEAQGDVDVAQEAGAEFVARLRRIGILGDNDDISAVLSLDVTDLLERRLQTVAYRQGSRPRLSRPDSSSFTATSPSTAPASRARR